MKTQALASKSSRKTTGLAPVSVIKVERSGRRAIAYEMAVDTSTTTKRTLRKALKPVRAGKDLFTSPSLPLTLSNAFKEAVAAAKLKYG